LIIKISNEILIFLQAKGLGYAINTSEELKFVKEVAAATGVVLDPVYRYAQYFAMHHIFSPHGCLLLENLNS
jgi:1-aminocyclopropane-1-carboxylate deaminase/D-cysteine desulfhydrase-like pyridoxal-dependent ACC family enzyme